MPRKQTIRKAMQDKRAGKSPRTQAGEFVREEMEKIRRGEHGELERAMLRTGLE
jgi:predicted transcriptional regulator